VTGVDASEEPVAVGAPFAGAVVSIEVAVGEYVGVGQTVAVLESMKMEHPVGATVAGIVVAVASAAGEALQPGDALLSIRPAAEPAGASAAGASTGDGQVAAGGERPDVAEVRRRHERGLDAARPEAVAKRHGRGQRTARENIADLVDEGSFVEYGPLVLAAQRRRRSLDELIERTPADGLVGGIARVNGEAFGPDRSRCVVASYDYLVLAGTQGYQNHRKKDRLFELASAERLPVVLFAEGGGGRPGDTDTTVVSGLDCLAFNLFGRLSALVPLVGIASGRCFAGNAALLGCCDVVIATADANIGMGGPAMIEGGGLGVFRPEEIGPLEVQAANGVVDLAVADEAEAVAVARRYLSYFQGRVEGWVAPDQDALRTLVPENRRQIYDVRAVIEALVDEGSVLELRRGFAAGMVTALVRVEGRPLGLVANDPSHLGGAIDRDGADKAARFLQLCDAHGLPVVSLCDTPGFMVGPDSEQTATVRHFSRLFVTGANLRVPLGVVILRKAYGLGAQAMAGGSFKAPRFVVAWPTGEVGGMGLEGAVRLGFRRELEAIADDTEREQAFEAMVAAAYEQGRAVNAASVFELDDVIDPVDTRQWITTALGEVPAERDGPPKARPFIDTW
jgi:acetyl-CoA carboxylase carboxyltransferase component